MDFNAHNGPFLIDFGAIHRFRGHPPASPEFWQDAASMALIEGEIVNCVISLQRGKDPYGKFFVHGNWKTGLWSKKTCSTGWPSDGRRIRPDPGHPRSVPLLAKASRTRAGSLAMTVR